jgi:hypothetical protein
MRLVRVTRIQRYAEGFNGWAAHLFPISTHNQTVHSVDVFVDGEAVPTMIGTTEEGLSKFIYVRVDKPGPFEIKFVCEATLNRSWTEAGSAPPAPLSAQERELALKPSWPEDFNAPGVHDYLAAQGLVRRNLESESDFIQRVAVWFAANERYLDSQPKSDALGILTSGGGQCNQLNAAFTMILKCAGIPARCYPGYVGARFDSRGSGHMDSEAWVTGVGWVSTDAVRIAGHGVRDALNSLGVQRDPLLQLGFNSLTIARLPNGAKLGGFNWRHFQLAADQGSSPKPSFERNLTEVLRQY